MKPSLMFAGVAALLLTACATMPPPVSLQERPGQSLTYVRGTPCVEARMDLPEGPVLASLCAESESTRRAILIIRIANHSRRTVTIRNGALVAAFGGQSLKVLGHKELMAEERARQTWAAIGAGLAAVSSGMEAADAGRVTYSGYGTTVASIHGQVGPSTITAHTSFRGTLYDGAAAAAAQDRAAARNDAMFDELAIRNQMAEAVIANALRPHTMAPGEAHATFVAMELPRRAKGEVTTADVTLRLEGASARFGVRVGP